MKMEIQNALLFFIKTGISIVLGKKKEKRVYLRIGNPEIYIIF